FVREIRNMLLEGVTGITTCTAPSTPFTTSKNLCLPSSISSIHSTFLFHQAAILFAAVVGLSPIARIDRSPSEVRGLRAGRRPDRHRSYILFPPPPTTFPLPP